ncbi:MAG: YetF domain-containing protein [Oscillospiraceae bacterium]|jgi:uncharacterized membrane protein YcaP (DUF421 family)
MAVVFARTLIVFLVIIVSIRIMGKRQLGELEPSELVVAVLISDLAAHPLQDIGIPLLNGLIPAITLLSMELLISGLIMRSSFMQKLICGKPSILIENGKIIQAEMKKNRFTLEELYEELRSKSITDISAVQYAILETDGTLNIIQFPVRTPVTAAQMGIDVQPAEFPVIVVNDGKLMEDNMHLVGLDIHRLNERLQEYGASRLSDVYMLSVNMQGDTIHFAPMEGSKL